MTLTTPPEGIEANGRRSDGESKYGVHEWSDLHGNRGLEVVSERQLQLRVVRVDGLFDDGNCEQPLTPDRVSMTAYFRAADTKKRKKLFVVVDESLPELRKAQIEAYFARCKLDQQLEDYRTMQFAPNDALKTLDSATSIVQAAKKFGIRRRDLLIAVGGTTVVEVVGFAAAIFRRSVPYISVPTDVESIIECYNCDRRVTINHTDNRGNCHRGLLGLYHLPIVSFYDSSFLNVSDNEKLAYFLSKSAGCIDSSDASDSTPPRSDSGCDVYEWMASDDIRYHVAAVDGLFNRSNETLVQNYCVDWSTSRKRNLLVVVDDFFKGNTMDDISRYFKIHSSAIGKFCVIPMHISSTTKDTASVHKVVDAAIKMGMTQQDLFIAVGGGTLMDIVGFAAAMFKGGTGYLRIPTTLLGIIDAGVGVKVGVNLGDHKNLIGSYFAPVACLNDPATFMGTLPQREFACGVAEAIKMAIIKSPRLFEVIEKHHRDVKFNTYTHELIYLSILTMLEELQPNLHEQSLLRLVDFGHEFGHIVESLTGYELPHGECVALGMAISSYLAFLKRIIPREDLDRILTLTLDMGLPIYSAEYDCCNPDVLWKKISTDGTAAKDGMLYLVIPKTIGEGTFLHHITDINADLVTEAVHGLQRYTVQFGERNRLKKNGFTETTLLATKDGPKYESVKSLGSTIFRHSEPIMHLRYPETFTAMENEDLPQEASVFRFTIKGSLLKINGLGTESPMARTLERSLNRWFYKLPASDQALLTEYASHLNGLPIRVRSDPEMKRLGEFTIEEEINDGQRAYLGYVNIHAGLAVRSIKKGQQEKLDDVVGHEGYHLLSFLSRGRVPLQSDSERLREDAMAERWKDFLERQGKAPVIVVDVGATYLRTGVMGLNGALLGEPSRAATPSPQTHPQAALPELQEKLLDTLAHEVVTIVDRYSDIPLTEIGISFGAVITNDGIVQNASILWNGSAEGYDFKNALQQRLPAFHSTVLNDVSAAAWRYHNEGRFCLVTVSSGLSNKVFNPELAGLNKLDIDSAGVGGEMGHVVVDPRAADGVVQSAIKQAKASPEEFKKSQLSALVHGNAEKISSRHLGMAFNAGDGFAVRLLEEADIPCCACGNIADLCSYSSGRGALRIAKRLTAREEYNIKPEEVTDNWLMDAIASGHPLGLKVLDDATYPLALRILQLAADIGLDKFIIVGGFALKTGKDAYLEALQRHLVRYWHNSGFFTNWTEDKIRELVRFGTDDDNDGLIGIGHYVQNLRGHYRAVEKAIGTRSLRLVTRQIPRCGAREVLAKVLYAGICTTDLQILRGERGLEPTVLGHEGVLEVLEIGKEVKGVKPGEMVVLNPNNPLDDYEKLGHTYEGVFQEYIKFGQQFLDRNQVLNLGTTVPTAADTLVEPLSCVVAAQERLKERTTGKNVLIIGAGVMGLMFVMTSEKYGAKNVFLGNRSQGKLDYAIKKGIVAGEKTFVLSSSNVSAEMKKMSGGAGVDIIIVCVSLGQGARVAQDCFSYINPGGCVYFFAGFRPGDELSLDGGKQLDIWPIRTGWKTEKVQVGGKPAYVSGHRGSTHEHITMAGDLIRGDTLSFSRVISHVISIDVLPETLSKLAEDEHASFVGAPAKRVIIDMEPRHRVLEVAEDLPLRQLREASGKEMDLVPSGNLFRELGFEDGSSMLGFVFPPAWADVQAELEQALGMASLKSKKDFIFVGTGAWGFLVDALKEVLPGNKGIAVYTLQTLDPQALVDLFSRVKDVSKAVCLGISKSGTTLETVMLMKTLRERFDSAGLDYRKHFVWLTDTGESGEATIRASKEQDWEDVDVIPLTVKNRRDLNALFCAPHSMIWFLAMAVLLGRDNRALGDLYRSYLAQKESVVHSVLEKAYFVASSGVDQIQVNMEESSAMTLEKLARQLVHQGLGAKQDGFNPRIVLAPSSFELIPGFRTKISIQTPGELPAVVKAMLGIDALSIFVASVGYHRRINFVTHPNVNRYKRRAMEIVANAGKAGQPVIVSSPEEIGVKTLERLRSNKKLQSVHLLCYGLVTPKHKILLGGWLAESIKHITEREVSIEVYAGEEWNHSVYQAASQFDDILYVVMVPQHYASEVEGISKETIGRNVEMLRAIAKASYETLVDKAVYFLV